MGGKHLKKLRAERAKIKLKKKKLSKGQNVTDTTFKIKRIVTVEQLRQVNENEPVSSWNVPLKELLVHLHHYNHTVRLNNLTGLRELIRNYPAILKGPSLRCIIIGLLELMTDAEHKIRANAIHLLGEIFHQLPSSSLIPFYDILNVHVCCAMTHSDLAVQQDSLRLVNLMVEIIPQAIMRNFSRLIKNFIRILKNYKYGHHSEVEFSKKSKLDLETSKTEMFNKFYQLLSLLNSASKKHDQSCQNDLILFSSIGRYELNGRNNIYKKIPDLSALFKNSKNLDNASVENSEEFQSHVTAIVPLLFDTWAEFKLNLSDSDNYISECALPESLAQLLNIILKLFMLLFENSCKMGSKVKTWFVSNYATAFIKSFLLNFPYLPVISLNMDTPKSSIRSGSDSSLTAYMAQNLILCYLFLSFEENYKNKRLDSKIHSYILNALTVKNPSECQVLCKVIEATLLCRDQKTCDEVVAAVVKAYESTNNYKFRRSLFHILVGITQSEKHDLIKQNRFLESWMNSLPDKLLELKIPPYVVETVLKIVNRESGKKILERIQEKIIRILEKLPNMEIGEKNEIDGQKLVANILYRCDNAALEKVLEERDSWDKSYNKELKKYVVDLILYKLKKSTNNN